MINSRPSVLNVAGLSLRKLTRVMAAGVLAGMMSTVAAAEDAATSEKLTLPADPHAEAYAESEFPSANACRDCHQQIYDEWSSSNHAYASISPMFHKFEQAVNTLTQGTMGSFCVRCHQQIGTQRGEKRYLPLWERSQIAREGITCVTCHRVAEAYGKVNGERNVVPGDIYVPMVGALTDTKFDETLDQADDLRIATDDTERGTKVHTGVIKFQQISESEFCVSCHQVAVNLGIKLEVVWDQYRDSPSFRKGETCQECHMGKVPGKAKGYATGPSAVVNGVEINPGRRHSNHAFYGPGYPIAHPGVFPHNPDAAVWDIEEWLMFDYRGGWGTEDFEDNVEDIASAFDDLHVALEPVGGGLEAYSAIDLLERNISRGVVGFETKIGRDRMLAKVETLDGAFDADAMEDAIAEAEEAIEGIRDAADDLGVDMTAMINDIESKLSMITASAGALDGFDAAYAGVVETLNSYEGSALGETGGLGEEGLAVLTEQVAALKASIPGANSGFRAAVDAVKEPLNIDFPFAWQDPSDREDAWAVVEVNLEALEYKRELRKQVMENGSRVDGPYFDGPMQAGRDLDFKYVITNTDEGHNLPSGSLGAQPEIWFNVALTDPDGNRVWESGYVDKYGDMVDLHSLELAEGTIEHDDQLFNLQTKFLTTNVKGTDREMYLPVSFDIDQRPFLRPSNFPTTVINHAPFVRMEGRSIPPLGNRDATYSVPGELLTKPGTYKLSARLRSRAEPIYFMRFVGATNDMEQSMNEWMLDFHAYSVEFEVK